MFSKVSKEYPVIAWFSGGITSAVACWIAINLFGIDDLGVTDKTALDELNFEE